MAKHVAILYGGWSAEREVSLASGRACCKALEEQGYKVTPIDVQSDIATVLQAVAPDVVFNALHGRVGEDGTIQGLLELLKIPYPFRRPRLGARHAEGQGENRHGIGRRAGSQGHGR